MMSKYKKSEELLNRAKKSLAGGVASEFRKYQYPHALFYSHASGSRLYDVDGNEYLDFTLSQGPMITGHNHPHVMKRVTDYSQQGQLYAGQHLFEIELAEKMQSIIPSAERMRFCLDGSEAIQTAFRLARAKTGKYKFIRFEGHYHGWLDNVAWGLSSPTTDAMGDYEQPTALVWSAGVMPSSRDEFILLPWNNSELLKKTVEDQHLEIAAIITEPIMCNNGCILPEPGFLETMRQLCDQYNITCIFDEVITGFRASLSGAQGYFHITPDLSIFAKAMASGFPISAIVGKSEWFALIEQGKVIHAGTMNSSNATVAAALATIEVLEKPGTYEHLFNLGTKLMIGLEDIGKKYHQNVLIQGLGPMFHIGFTDLKKVKDFRDVQAYDKIKLGKFVAGLHDEGVRILGRGLWYISIAHTDADIDHALNVADKVMSKIEY